MTTSIHAALPPGTRYYLPDSGERLPHAVNPSTEILESALAWARPWITTRFGSRVGEQLVAGMADWGRNVYPLADPDRLEMILRVAWAALVVDDPFTRTELRDDLDATRHRVNRYLAAVEGHEPPETEPEQLMLWRTVEPLANARPGAWARRVRRVYTDILHSAVSEAEHRINAVELPWPEYVQFRRINLYGFWVTLLAELAVDVDMTLSLERHAILRDFELAVVDHVLFTNDLYSMPKETRLGETANTFWLLMRDSTSIQHGINRLSALIVDRQDQILRGREEILAGPLGEDDDVRRYVEALCLAAGGNLQFHRVSPRYHGHDHDGTPVNRGTVVIGETSNRFIPDQPARATA